MTSQMIESPEQVSIIELGELRLDIDEHRVTLKDQPIELTLTQFQLLEVLLKALGNVLSRRALITLAMGRDVVVTERTVDVHISLVRKKLGEYGHIIETVRGVGYRIAKP